MQEDKCEEDKCEEDKCEEDKCEEDKCEDLVFTKGSWDESFSEIAFLFFSDAFEKYCC